MNRTLRNAGWLALLAATATLLACGGDDYEDLSDPSAGGSGGSSSSGACETNADCSGSTPICDELAGACVQCLFDTQCEEGQSCKNKACTASTTCSSSLDCVDNGSSTICDPASSTCVECVAPEDCPTTADCVANTCVPYVTCESSLDCPQGQVCAAALGRCVECETKADCPEGDECVANACQTITECVSDNQCTPLGKLCDKSLGFCVDCLDDDQCPDAYHCAAGACALDVCEAGASRCDGNAIVTCSANGDGWGSAEPCGGETTCKTAGSNATCAPWVCDAGLSYCEGTQLLTCSADGLSVESSVDCTASGKNCFDGACSDQACAPSATYCEGKEVRSCNAQGSSYTVVDTCGASEYCDDATASCKAMVCTPGAPVCNGDVATTCNAEGSGYTAGGTNCASQGKSCSEGVCAACPAQPGPGTHVRMTEVFIGTDDYIVLENRGSCAAQLDGMMLQVIANPNNGDDLHFDLPAYVLQPGESVYVRDANSAEPGDIAAQQNIFLTPDTGEYVMLCVGACSSNTVVDYFAHASGQSPPLPPYGITFTPGPLSGITNATQDVKAYVRTGFTGSFPAFKAGDWQLGDASRPYENPVDCPPTQPAQGSACSSMTSACTYGAVTCICFTQWMCT